MKNKIPTLPIIIRMRKDGEGWTPVAFFPTLPGTCEDDMLCYERVGQHGHACLDYIASCVTPKSSDSQIVTELLEEVSRIYETGPDAVKLIQRRRVHQHYSSIRKENYRNNH